MDMLNWHIVATKAEYKAGTPIESHLYFIEDTHEIYRGTENYTQSAIMVDEFPDASVAAVNRLYILKGTLEGKIFDGTSFSTAIKPVTDTVEATGNLPVTGKAVAAYVAAEVAKITGGSGVVSRVEWDGANQLLDVYAGDGSKQSITFDGLGVSLSYDKTTSKLQLLDTNGDTVGDPINLDIERFVTGGEYNAESKTIVLYFDGKTGEASTDKIEIPVGDLVDTYTAEDTATVGMSVVGNKFSATVRISTEGGNVLVAKEDGLYVSVPDISGKMDKVAGATENHILVADADGQAKDSGINISAIKNHTLFEGNDTPEAAVGAGTAVEGDYCIITKEIGTGTGKFEKTAYLYHEGAWVALDGNYNAENVYFAEDLLTTSAVGNITLTNGQATIAAKGKNLKELFNTIFVKEKNPAITQPSVSVSCPQAKAYEVGTSVTPTYTATLNGGKYEFGPATGITAKSWVASDTPGHSQSVNSGSFDAFVVEDNTNYSISAVATYDDGAIPVTNVGNAYADGQIKAGSKSGTSSSITGFRAGFYGTLTAKDGEINSALVRSLSGKTTATPKAGNVWNLPVPVGAMRIVFAYPASIRDVNSVLDVNGMNAEIKSAFTQYTVDVEGANGYTAMSYKVYVMDLAAANDAANTYKITL